MAASILGPDGRPISSTLPDADYGTANNNWYRWKNEYIDYVVNPDNIPIRKYEQMLDTDETVFSGIEFITMAALKRLGDYTHPTTKIEDFVRSNLTGMKGTFTAKCADILTALSFGYSTTEILWMPGKGDGKVRLRGLQTLHPDTTTYDISVEGDNKNEVTNVRQWFHQANAIDIDPRKCILYAHRGRFANAYGKPRLKPAFKSWFIKDIILKAWGIACQRYGTPYAIGKTAPGKVQVNGQSMDAFAYLSAAIDSMGESGSLVTDLVTEVDLKYASGNFGDTFHQAVTYCNTMIYRALGLPSLIADSGSTGSYSLGKQHYELFVLVLEHILDELIDVLIEQLIKPLIIYNFGVQADGDYGDFQLERLQMDDEKLLSEILCNLEASGTLDNTRLDDVNWMRERVGLPLLTKDELQPMMPAMPPGQEGQPPVPGMPTDPFKPLQPVQPKPKLPKEFSWQARHERRLRKNTPAYTFGAA